MWLQGWTIISFCVQKGAVTWLGIETWVLAGYGGHDPKPATIIHVPGVIVKHWPATLKLRVMPTLTEIFAKVTCANN